MAKFVRLGLVLLAGLLAGVVVTVIPWPSLTHAAFAAGMCFGVTALVAGAVLK